jgi:hypothetical protein
VDFVPPAGQAASQVGYEGLRTAALRLTDGRHERRHDGDLHCASFIGSLSLGHSHGATLIEPAP